MKLFKKKEKAPVESESEVLPEEKPKPQTDGGLCVGDVVLCRSPSYIVMGGELKKNMKWKRAVVVAFEDDTEREIGHRGEGEPLVVIPGSKAWTKYREVTLDTATGPYSHEYLVSLGLKPRRLHEKDLEAQECEAREADSRRRAIATPARSHMSDGDLLNLTRHRHRIRASLHSM